MGWRDTHPHEFSIRAPLKRGRGALIGIPDRDGFEDRGVMPGWEVPVRGYLQKPGDRAEYAYDFGDDWHHAVELEAIRPRQTGTKYPRCTGGERACPLEDYGGPHGYGELVGILADRSHPEHQVMRRWAGRRFDPAAFDPAKVHFDNPRKRWTIAFESE